MGCLACAGFIKGMAGEDGAARLVLKGRPPAPVEASNLVPEAVAGRSESEIAALPVDAGTERLTFGDLFTITPGLTQDLVLEGDLSRVHGIGRDMGQGRLLVRGNVGDHLGAFMRGGVIEVEGDAGEFAGAQMSGGTLHIHGNAGDRAGAAYPGRLKGMNRGAILIDGRAGEELGAGMRRGLIAVRGDAGGFTGARMTSGTIFVFGRPGAQTGVGNRRGSIVVLGGVDEMPPSYVPSCSYSPTFLNCFYKQFREWGWDLPEGVEFGLYRRHMGDMNVNGKGEILVFKQSE